MIVNNIQRYFLNEIKSEWISNNRIYSPKYIWIAEYQDISDEHTHGRINKLPINVWLLDKNGFSVSSIFDYQRLIYILNFVPFSTPKNEDGSYILGFAEFAKYQKQLNTYYFSISFGGLCAKGFRKEFDEFGNLIEDEWLWIS